MKTISKTLIILFLFSVLSYGQGCSVTSAAQEQEKQDTEEVEKILGQLNDRTQTLRSYQADIEYLFSQPLLDSKILRKGILYYQKTGKNTRLRVNFQTIKQDQEKERKEMEQYIFDGLWLTQIDYGTKEVKLYQQSDANEPNKPVDVFEMVSRNFPLIGFTKTKELKNQFEITLIDEAKTKMEGCVQLHLYTKPQSIYKDNYSAIDFWIDKKQNLPIKIVAVSPDNDIYEIRLLKTKVNEKLNDKIFEFEIPKDFAEPEIIRR